MRFAVACGLMMLFCVSCSNDSKKDGGNGGADASASGGSSGSTGSGGTSSSGSGGMMNTGGADPALCNIESGTDACLLCLARYCCDTVQTCFADSRCKAAFDTEQECFHSADVGTDQSACYSSFVMADMPDGGPRTHPMADCILRSCGACGIPGLF